MSGHQIRIPSKQIYQIRYYFTTGTNQVEFDQSKLSVLASNTSLDPWFLSGFTDGEGSFIISITRRVSVGGGLG